MPTDPANRLIDHLFRSMLPSDSDVQADGELLSRFIERHDEAALAAIVRRHAGMVWGVCNRALQSQQDAEDAFQSTFLVLVRKATSIVPRGNVGNWLYGVANLVTTHAKRGIARRRKREVHVIEMPDTPAQPGLSLDVRFVLDEELVRLPDIYRAVIVLCELEGWTRKEAARLLGVPDGTVGGRLARAKALLAERLTRRGVVFSSGSMAALSAASVSASAPPVLVSSTIKAASLLAVGRAATGVVPVKVAALTEGVMKAMLMTRGTTIMKTVLCSGLLLAFCGMVWAIGGNAEPHSRAATSATSPPDGDDPKAKGQIALGREGHPRELLYPDKPGPKPIIGRLTVNGHGMKQGTQVFSVGLELDNMTGREAILQFDPKVLKLELLDAKGKVIEEGPTVRSGPAPIPHKATIPTGGYVGISTYRGGIGLAPKSILLAAGGQAWVLKPGTYRVRGTVTVLVAFGEKVLDPLKPDAPESKPGDAPQTFKLDLIERRFALKVDENAPRD